MREREGSYGVRQPHRRLSRPNGYLRWAKLVFFVFIQQRIALPTLRVKITGLRVLSVSLRVHGAICMPGGTLPQYLYGYVLSNGIVIFGLLI